MKISKEKIDEAKSILGGRAAEIIAKELKIEMWDGKKGKSIFKPEKTPSMIWFDEKNTFKCFATGRTYDIIDHFCKFHKKPFCDAVKELFDIVKMPYEASDFKDNYNSDKLIGYKYPSDEPENDRKIVEKYAETRSISPETLDYCHVKQDGHGNMAFQLYNGDGVHMCTKYRLSRPATNKDLKWWWQKDSSKCPVLYNMDRIDTTKPLLIVEGFVDCLAAVESGFINTVSINGGAEDYNWIEFNYDWLEKFSSIIIWSDNDAPGEAMRKECINRLGLARIKLVTPDEEVLKKVRNFYRENFDIDCNKCDCSNVLSICGKDDVLRLIDNAKEVPNPRLKDLWTYDEIELANLPFISTGFKSVDKVIMGNFDNNLIVLTGFAGSGKSSMISEMGIISPLEAGKNIMIFSGEANGGTLLGTTFRPLAGRNHILQYENTVPYLPPVYKVTPEAKKAIREAYKGRIWNYEDGEEISTTAEEILTTMEYAYKRHNVTFFSLDNLMCIACATGDDEDKYAAQIKFALALKKFTRRYPVTVILVAHPKKPAPGQKEAGMYDISGSSEIVNLADRAFAVGILKEDPQGYNSYLTVVKDRQTGKVGQKVKMYYDYATGRIYSDEEELNRKYSWEENANITYPPNMALALVANQANHNKFDESFGG